MSDFPHELLLELEGTFIGQADTQRERARVATGQGPAPTQHQQNISAAGHPCGFYESALAYHEAARALRSVHEEIVRRLKPPAREPHPWPLDGLEQLDHVHPHNYYPGDPEARQEHAQRFPRWGVINGYGTDNTTTLTVGPASATVGGIIVRTTSGDGDFPEAEPEGQIQIQIDFEQWDAINALVQRIRAGELIPYDHQGNARGPQPQQERQR